MKIPTRDFEPQNTDEYICLQIAKSLGETNMQFILSCLKKYGIGAIERAWGLINETPDGKIRDRCRYFNKVVRNIGNKR